MLEIGHLAERGCPLPPSPRRGSATLSPLPSPLRRAIAHLLGQFPVGDGASRGGIEHRDGLAEGRRLGQPNSPGDDAAAHLVGEVLPYLVGHIDARRVRASNIVSTMVVTSSSLFRLDATRWTLRSSWLKPSRA